MTAASERDRRIEGYPLLLIVGPTACGKTELAARTAERARAAGWPRFPLLNADSVQVYSSIEIGAAKPSSDQLARAPHVLLGHVPEGQNYTAGDFRRDALAEIERARKDGAPGACAVGGSGFYIQALERGMPPMPPSDKAIRANLEARADRDGLPSLHAELTARDPARAARIAPGDRYRVVRALEIMALQPLTLTELDRLFAQAGPDPRFSSRKIGLERSRDRLRKAVEARTDAMIAGGLLEETEALRARGLSAWSPLLSVGYKEAQAVLTGQLAREGLREAIVTSTMQLAKRQMTWFRRDSAIVWRDADESFDVAEADAAEWLQDAESRLANRPRI